MKARILLMILLLFKVYLQAQKLTVVYCTPGCRHVEDGKVISIGDMVSDTETLSVDSQLGRIVLWDRTQGLHLLTAKSLDQKKWKTMGTMSELDTTISVPTGYQERFQSMDEVIAHFKDRRYLLLERSWLISSPPYNLKGDTLLFIRYERPKTNIQVTRKLESRGDSLLLDPKFILDMNGRRVPPDDANHFRLCWIDKKTLDYKELTPFEFIFADQATLQGEVGFLIDLMAKAGSARTEIEATVYQYLNAIHGCPDPHNMNHWLQQHFPKMP
jgi:hypothetical protein